MTGIRSGTDAAQTSTAPVDIDWSCVVGVEIWSVKSSASRQIDAPAGLDIRWMTGAGVQYAVTVVFEDDTWVWIRLQAEVDDAVREVNRLAAEHNKQVRRGAQRDEALRARGY